MATSGKPIDPYQVIGVSSDADDREIKRAYRALSLKCHPDRFPGNDASAAEFRLIADAYELIDTEEKRKRLKQTLGASLRHGAGGAAESYYRRMFRLEG